MVPLYSWCTNGFQRECSYLASAPGSFFNAGVVIQVFGKWLLDMVSDLHGPARTQNVHYPFNIMGGPTE
jgi:hypothetical protein